MMTTKAMHTADPDDAGLVAEILDGNREAFRKIVERYQTLISSIAYCATGNMSQSEDLAQETFVTAWKQLAELREPAKLRSWLCSITRFLVSKEFRRRGRDPVHAAESLASVAEWPSPEPLPPDHVISEEEKAILWRSLERIPEMYREPLVLFYREHQSIEAVARDLELSEDAVKQRLSRGRKLLQEEVLAFVAGALKQTTPGETFTLGVMAALPLLLTTAKVATAGVAAAEGGAMAKATGLGAILQGILKAVSGLLGVLSPILLLGGYFGLKMGGDARQSAQQRESVAMFWRIMVGCLAAFVVLPMLVLIFLAIIHVDFSGDLPAEVVARNDDMAGTDVRGGSSVVDLVDTAASPEGSVAANPRTGRGSGHEEEKTVRPVGGDCDDRDGVRARPLSLGFELEGSPYNRCGSPKDGRGWQGQGSRICHHATAERRPLFFHHGAGKRQASQDIGARG